MSNLVVGLFRRQEIQLLLVVFHKSGVGIDRQFLEYGRHHHGFIDSSGSLLIVVQTASDNFIHDHIARMIDGKVAAATQNVMGGGGEIVW